MADPRSSEEATNIHGLFGAVIVEPPGARWFHPETGEEMESGLMADLYQPGKPAFREYTVFFHDELEILDKDGNPPVDHRTGLPSSTTAISYRSEPMRNRMPLTHDPADSGEDTSMSSWVYGDPAPSILRAYVGHHVHLVKFDTITSDGAANGWNNIAGARKYETLVERFFADEELRTVFFHDHLFANAHQFHGVFGALVIEEAGASFHDIRSGEELRSGTKAVIRRRDGTSFREFALFVHDFANLFDKDGNPLNPPAVPGGHDDPADRRGA